MTGRDKFEKNKKAIEFLVSLMRFFPKSILIFIWNLISNHSQLPFVLIRYLIIKNLIKNCGDNLKIGTNVQILAWEKLEIGNNVSIHANTYIDATGCIKIGDNVSIAHNSTILSSNHGWSDKDLPIKYNPINLNAVLIEEDVWIGCACRILAGVTIGSRSIIAAGAIVSKDVDSNVIIGGVPGKIIKKI